MLHKHLQVEDYSPIEVIPIIHANNCVTRTKYFVGKYKHSGLSKFSTVLLFVSVILLSFSSKMTKDSNIYYSSQSISIFLRN